MNQAPALSDFLASSTPDRALRLAAQQEALAKLTRVMTNNVELHVDPIFAAALAAASEGLGAQSGMLHLADEDRGVMALVHAGAAEEPWQEAWRLLSLDSAAPPVRAHQEGAPAFAAAPGDPAAPGPLLSTPVSGAEVPLGALSLCWPAGTPEPDQDARRFLSMVGLMVGLAIEHAGLIAELIDQFNELARLRDQALERGRELGELNQRLQEANDQLAELSVTDELTGLANRRLFSQRLEVEIYRARRQGSPLCLIMADLDHFKRINDRLGHQVGDEALVRFAAWAKEGVRELDLTARWGGEEFAVLLVDCDGPSGVEVAEKLRRRVGRLSQGEPFNELGGFTVSLGVAGWEEWMQPADLVAAADAALYRAKEGGRDRVVLAQA